MQTNESSIKGGFFWKILERFGVQGTQFFLQLLLARLLSPEHYGVLSLMVIFTTLATVFIQNGFNMSLIQKKDVDEEDYSSVFWLTLGIATVIYIIIFLAAPFIASFYDMPEIVMPLRVLATVLLPGAINSIQIAKVSRALDFKKIFTSNVGAVIVAGVTGVIIAYYGGGIWALVAQNFLVTFVATVVMWFTVKWRPKFIFNFTKVKQLFSFGWKLLVSSLIDTLYQDLRSLVIGKKYNSETLGFYNRGKQFPQFIINAVNGAVRSVMLPAMAKNQDDKAAVKNMTRKSITLSSYILFPVMLGLAAVAAPLIEVLLTDKWLPAVPYMQIYCITFAFYPIHSCNLQAINALGRSDIFLKLEIIKKSYGIISLLIAVIFFHSPISIAFTGIITALISSFVNSSPNKKLMNYSYFEQVKDILPSILLSVIMFIVVYLVGLININNIVVLLLQVIVGVSVYVAPSYIFRLEPFMILLKMIKTKKID